MKNYLASYQNGKGECWDLEIRANNYAEGLKEARSHQKEMGKIWSFRAYRGNK